MNYTRPPRGRRRRSVTLDSDKVRAIMTAQSMSTSDIARKCGVSVDLVRAWLSGKRGISVRHLAALSIVLNYSTKELTQ